MPKSPLTIDTRGKLIDASHHLHVTTAARACLSVNMEMLGAPQDATKRKKCPWKPQHGCLR
jgi:hypothetical protein